MGGVKCVLGLRLPAESAVLLQLLEPITDWCLPACLAGIRAKLCQFGSSPSKFFVQAGRGKLGKATAAFLAALFGKSIFCDGIRPKFWESGILELHGKSHRRESLQQWALGKLLMKELKAAVVLALLSGGCSLCVCLEHLHHHPHLLPP